MTIAQKAAPARSEPLGLQAGDRMTREEFHRAYEQAPPEFRAELIGGTVYVPSPLRRTHGTRHSFLGALFVTYEGNTPGTEVADNATVFLGDEGEPQPDLLLRILPEYGGQSRTTADDYVESAPELVAEVAHSSRAIDLYAKKVDYSRYGVLEYLVLSIADRKIHWFDLPADRERSADPDGILRIQTFPGLWLRRRSCARPGL